MEFHGCSSSSSLALAAFLKTFRQLAIKVVLGNVISVLVCLLFGIVGTFLGAIHGAIIGQRSEQGYLCGASFGAVSGAFLSVEVAECFHRLWLSHEKRIHSLIYLLDVLVSLVNGKLVRERLGPVLMINPRQSHMETDAETEVSFNTKGLSVDRVKMIPVIDITSDGEKIQCSVCLDEFQVGEKARRLPYCNHMFHPSCIDKWLVRCGSCPLCRRNL